jgi:murein L,D-transpeptidase YafK
LPSLAEQEARGPWLYLRAFKHERELEAWLASDEEGPYRLYRTWPVAGQSGNLGPKRREGDRQVPEGLYRVDRFNPNSAYHLSLGIDYPNASDRLRGDPARPGSDIFIHGSDQSIGCLAMTDPVIEVVYGLAERAKAAGQSRIRVDIFPFRMEEGRLRTMSEAYPYNAKFWAELQPFYLSFQRTRRVPRFQVGASGEYLHR